ncbi:hypothetical protein Bhyg_07644, partial [Pseudolycoriella hygida]
GSRGSYDGNDFNLEELLNSDVCAGILAYYEEHKRFDEDIRKQFMKIMCNELLKGPRVSNERISQISDNVCLVFVTENKTPYYDKQPGAVPTGIFYNMYRNRLKSQPTTKKKSQKGKAQDLLDEEICDLEVHSSEGLEDIVTTSKLSKACIKNKRRLASRTADSPSIDGDDIIQTTEISAGSSGLGHEQLAKDGNQNSLCKKGSRGSYDGNDFNLEELLNSDVCAGILAYYEEHKRFDEDIRKQFMKIMCNELLKGPRVSNERISQISDNVCLVFVTENKTPYYDKQPGAVPTGIFYNMYRNRLKSQPTTKKKSQKGKAQDLLDEEICDLEALRKASYNNVSFMLENWPILKTSSGHILTNLDFKKDHGPRCAQSLFSNWTYIYRITDELCSMISTNNKKIRSLIENIPSEDTNYDNVVLAMAFHYLIRPRAPTLNFTLTMEGSLKSFYQFATDDQRFEQKVKQRFEFWRN